MPTPPFPRVVGALERPYQRRTRRLRHLLALATVALPLVAAVTASAGATAGAAPAAGTSRRHQVTVVDGLGVRLGVTDAADVDGALEALDVMAGPLDRVTPSPGAPLDGPMIVVIERMDVETEHRHVDLAYATVRVEDPELLRGRVEVHEVGSTGLRIDTALVLRVDGAIVSSLHLTSTHVREPVARVERVGTREPLTAPVWDALARCESGGRWDAEGVVDGRIVHRGGLQFADATWDAFRPADFPAFASDASREQQILVAERVLARQGWAAWPACSSRLGLR